MIIGNTKAWILGNEIAYKTDVPINSSKIYILKSHFSTNITTYNVGFTIQAVLYTNLNSAYSAFIDPGAQRITIGRGSTSYGYFSVTETAIVFDMYDGCEGWMLQDMIAFG